MSQQIPLYKKDTLVKDYPATEDFVTDAIDFKYTDWTFSITPFRDLVDGTPTYTVEVSSDKVKWRDYYDKFTDVSIEDAIEEVDYKPTFRYIRIKYNSGGATTGTITFYFINNNG